MTTCGFFIFQFIIFNLLLLNTRFFKVLIGSILCIFAEIKVIKRIIKGMIYPFSTGIINCTDTGICLISR